MSVNQDMPGPSPSCADVHDLTPGFAFGALDSDDQHAIEHHCERCPSCAATVHQARQTAMLLSFSVRPTSPPPLAKAALFARISQSNQVTSAPAAAFPSMPGITTAAALPPLISTPAPANAQPQAQPSSQSGRFHFPFPTRRRRGEGDRPWAGWSALTVPFATVPLVLALALVGVFAVRSQSRIDTMQQDLANARGHADRLQSTLDTIDGLIADADSRVYLLPPQNSGSQQGYGKVWAKPGESAAMLMVWGLQPTATGTGYQVVLESRSGKMIPCANFYVDRKGNGSALFSFDQPFTAYESVRVVLMPPNPTEKGSWANTELLSAPINPIVGQPGDTDLPPTQ